MRRGRRTSNEEWSRLWREHQWGTAGFAALYLVVLTLTFDVMDWERPFWLRTLIAVSVLVIGFSLPFAWWSGRHFAAMRDKDAVEASDEARRPSAGS